ncbi:MAG TPA: GNAT family N-acetyltransferase [Terriglobales bacterium]|jgi:GNAT superfamily N-acetyltransferase|nr:GNAT family N-acetyltransferase [Terriglobales bacterium]
MSEKLTAPEKLTIQHDLADFSCGEAALDDWLNKRALTNEESGASRTYVVCVGKRVEGYYTLAVGAVTHLEAPGRIRRNMPNPVPVMILGRLAVHHSIKGQGIGAGLLRDAVLRTTQASHIAGIRALLFHAISDTARDFYLRNGFVPSPLDPMTLMVTLADARRGLQKSKR